MPPTICLNSRIICDLELLLDGSFNPLSGFMNQKDYKSVVKKMRLSDGTLWPMPIVLPINSQQKEQIVHKDHVILTDDTNLPLAKLYVNDIYKPDLKRECKYVYGTNDDNHPYVKIVNSLCDGDNEVWYVGGEVEVINMPPHYDFKDLRMNPVQMRNYFEKESWTTVVGFQTRNPMHRSHIELTKYALNQAADSYKYCKNYDDCKLLIQPIVGVTQVEDIDYHTRVRCYKSILKYYPENKVKLSLLPLSMRMAGPREALWHALIRKNYGCTHFIVGRDHAGPSTKTKEGESFYGPYDAHELLEKHKDEIGINIVKSKMVVYLKDSDTYLPADEVPEGSDVLTISGTQFRKMLRDGSDVPSWFSYPEVVDELRKTVKPLSSRGLCIYFVGLSGSGKTTLAKNLENRLKEFVDRPITVLDGDVIRKNLSKGLGFSKEDRSANVRRIGYVASEIVKHGGIVICANIAPYQEDRTANREIISNFGTYLEIFVDTPIEICEKRDIKGLYKLARQGVIKQFTGVNDPFETPISDIVIDDYNGYHDIDKNLEIIINRLKELQCIE